MTMTTAVSAFASTSTSTTATATASAADRSKRKYLSDLKDVLNNARRLFADVCWRIEGDDEIIYGHRAILYARANAAFQARFLNPNGSARLQAIMSGSTLSLNGMMHSPSSPTFAAQQRSRSGASSAFSVVQAQQQQQQQQQQQLRRSASPGALSIDSQHHSPGQGEGTATPVAAAFGSKTPIQVSGTESAFFKGLLDFFYTAQTPLGEVFTFLFEDSSYIDKEDALDRLSQDLLFMWRSKLFADVSIQLADAMGEIPEFDDEANDDIHSDNGTIHEENFFPAHRAILAARCPYFHTIFLSPYADAESALFSLPSPPFTPASIHFTLAYIYTGSLNLNRTFDLTVAMHLYRSATYLNMDLLLDEVTCRITDMCHDFRACCKMCRVRSKRVFVFASSPEVNDRNLQRRAKRAVLDFFGETWDREIGELPYTTQKELLIDLCSQTNAANSATAMKGILQLRSRLANERAATWADHLRSMLIPLEDRIKHFLKTAFAEIVASRPFIELIDGIGFSNDVLEKLLSLLVDTLSENSAPSIYETLVGKVLLREEGITTDARGRVEETRSDILAYIKSRWVGIRAQNGFEKLENWCLKELSDELEQPVDDLLQSPAVANQGLTTRTGLRLASTKVHKVESDAFSVVSGPSSLRASVLNRNAARKSVAKSTGTLGRESVFTIDPVSPAFSASNETSRPPPSTSSPRTRTASAGSASKAINAQAKSPPAVRTRTVSDKSISTPTLKDDKPAAPDRPSMATEESLLKYEGEESPIAKGKDTTLGAGTPTPRIKKPPLVPATTKTVRLRNLSTASRTSLGKKSTEELRKPARPDSVSSVRSRSVAPSSKTISTTAAAHPSPPMSPKSLDLKSPRTPSRPSSVASSRSRVSSTSVRKVSSVVKDQSAGNPVTPPMPSARKVGAQTVDKTPSRPLSVTSTVGKRRGSVSSVASVKTTSSGRKVTPSKPASVQVPVPPLPKKLPLGNQRTPEALKAVTNLHVDVPTVMEPAIKAAPGSMLKVGIPCVVTIHKTKFRATVRYLGEVYFDSGTFVGVEVPVANNDLPENLDWNDGTVEQVKYFELGSRKTPSALEARLSAHKSRRPSGSSTDGRSTPTIDTPAGPSRGLFVRPSQGMSDLAYRSNLTINLGVADITEQFFTSSEGTKSL